MSAAQPLMSAAHEPSPWNVPNFLTVLRLVLVPCFVALLWLSHGTRSGWLIAATAVFGIGIATDYYDGALARAQGSVTAFGKLADPIADKALTGSALLGLWFLNVLSWPVPLLIIGRELVVTLLRVWVLRYGIISASWGGKLKTSLQMCAIGWYLWPWKAVSTWLNNRIGTDTGLATLSAVGPVLMGVAVIVTIVTGLDYIRRAWLLRRSAMRPADPTLG